ncbi:MAG: serine hydrolase domain-containing protein [Leptolyngbyaceae cyanobacterium MO_188.B28]|nr:serine hydrolase domain-containing protein [Leptolyngbyaceae cyanobacterium MO_188.B28]
MYSFFCQLRYCAKGAANRTLLLLFALPLLFSICCSYSVAQVDNPLAKVNRYVKAELEATGVPGAALVVVRGDDIALLETYGVAGPSGMPVTTATPFVIGSLTKSFTALAVMQLVEQGALDLDAPVQRYLPYFALNDQRTKDITVRHTINHTTGIAWWNGLGFEGSQDLSAEAIGKRVQALSSVRLHSQPGGTFVYSNVNYVIAGAVIEAVAGQSYEDYVTQNIFEPLQMNNSYASIGKARENGLAVGHRYIFGNAVAYSNLPYGRSDLPSYLLSSSIEDMGKYLTPHMNGGVYDGQRVLSEVGVEALHLGAAPTPYDDYYAMGWFDECWEGERVLNHYGSFTGYHANMMIAPEQDLGLVMLTNAESYLAKERRWEIAKNAFRILLEQDVQSAKVSASLTAFWVVILCSLTILGDLMLFSARCVRKRNERFRPVRSNILSLIFVTVGVGFLFGIPRIFDAPMSSIILSTPDAGYVFTLAGALGLIWGVIRTPLSVVLWRGSR